MKAIALFVYLTASVLVFAQQNGGYEIKGNSSRFAGRTIYLLAPKQPGSNQAWPVLDSARADAAGQFVLRGQVPGPEMYWLRVGRISSVRVVPLANQQERIAVRVAGVRETPEGTLPLLLLSGTPELALLNEFDMYYSPLLNSQAKLKNKELLAMQRQLRANASTYVAPYLAFTFLRNQPGTRPLLDSLTERFAREQPANAFLPLLRQWQTTTTRP
jgi:hypothetical protein